MDFESDSIDGKMKAPSGFFLQGRNKQSLQSMVKLRSSFKDRLETPNLLLKLLLSDRFSKVAARTTILKRD